MSHPVTLTEAHAKLRNKEISAVELTEACISRIEEQNNTLNAVVHTNFDAALKKAEAIDAAGVFDHPLTGIPYLAKDNFCENNVPTTACSNVLREKDYKPPFDSTTIARLNAAGAISLGKANTDEFTMGASSETSCFGPTMNPYDSTKIAGGSSGGSAAGLAAGMCLFSLGTDTGGSIRLPAAYCNVCGLRPTYGRTSRYGTMSMASSLDTIGPITRTMEDMAIVLQTMAGHDPLDGTTTTKPVPNYSAALTGDVKNLTIGVPQEYFIDGIDPEVETAIRNAIDTYEKLGATVQEISLPHTKYAVATYCVLTPCEVSSNMARYDGIRYGHTTNRELPLPKGEGQGEGSELIDYYFSARSEGFGDEVKRRMMIGTYALSAGYYDAYYRQAQKVRTLIKKDFDDAFADVNVILSPTAPTTAFAPGAHADDPVAMYLEDIFLDAQPLAGIPALSLPGGFSKAGLPIGLQLMSNQWQEEVMLNAAFAYQQETKWYTKI